MCARYTLSKTDKEITAAYGRKFVAQYEPKEHITITDVAPVITSDDPDLIQLMHFKLIPHNAKSLDDFKVAATFNARSEEAMTKPTWRPLLIHHKTCLVLSDGFIEWKKSNPNKGPYLFTLPDRPVFAMAGLYSKWKDPATGDVYESFAIVTTESNETVGAIHDKQRMPVILSKEEEKLWLSKDIPVADLLKLCDKYPDELMKATMMSKAENKPDVRQGGLFGPENSQ